MVSHRKVFREFSQLRLVQRWQAHTGVIWRLAFSATGAHLASAGRDRVIRIWENRRAPVDTSASSSPPPATCSPHAGAGRICATCDRGHLLQLWLRRLKRTRRSSSLSDLRL